MKFRKCTKEYLDLKKNQYIEVARYISDTMKTAKMEECEGSFELVKQMIINNESLLWYRLIAAALCEQLKSILPWIAVVVAVMSDVIREEFNLETNMLLAVLLVVFFVAISIEAVIKSVSDRTDALNLRILKDMSYEQYEVLVKLDGNYELKAEKDLTLNRILGLIVIGSIAICTIFVYVGLHSRIEGDKLGYVGAIIGGGFTLLGVLATILFTIRQQKESDIKKEKHVASILYFDIKSIESYLKYERSSVNLRYSENWQSVVAECSFLSGKQVEYIYKIYDLVYNYNYFYHAIEMKINLFDPVVAIL